MGKLSMHYIYKITDNLTGEYYIGKKCNTDPDNDSYYGSGANRICNSAKKHKGVGYTKEVLIFVADKVLLAELERDFIGEKYVGGSEYDSLCLNLKAGGKGGRVKGMICSETARKNMADAHKGHFASDETKKKLSDAAKRNTNNVGKTFSSEHRKKLSEANRGKSLSVETRKKMSESHKLRFQKSGV